MTDPTDPTELLQAADPAKNYGIDPRRVEAMLTHITAAPAAKISLLRSWQVRAAATIIVAAAVAVPVVLALTGDSTPPVLNFAATARVPRSGAAAIASGTHAPTALGAPIADLVPTSYGFVAAPSLNTDGGSADVYRITGGSNPGAQLLDLATTLGVTNGVENSSTSGWSVVGTNATLTGTTLAAPVAAPQPVPLGLPKTTMVPQTSPSESSPVATTPSTMSPTSVDVPLGHAGGTSSVGASVPSDTPPSLPGSSTTSTLVGAPAASDPVTWTYSRACRAPATPTAPSAGVGVAVSAPCAVASSAAGTASNADLIAWSKPLVSAIESKNLISASFSLGTPSVDTATNTVSYPYDFNLGAVTGGVTDSFGSATDVSFQFGDSGDLVFASGVIASTTLLDSYALVSEIAAVGLLAAQDRVGSPSLNPGTIMTVTPTTGTISTEPQSPSPSTGTTSDTTPPTGVGGSGSGTAVGSGPIDTVPITPTTSTLPAVTAPSVQSASVTETLESATLGYAVKLLTDGSAVLVPTYTFTAPDGSTWRVIALDPAGFNTAPTNS